MRFVFNFSNVHFQLSYFFRFYNNDVLRLIFSLLTEYLVSLHPFFYNAGDGSGGERTISPGEPFCRGLPRAILWADVSRQFAPISVSVSGLLSLSASLSLFVSHSPDPSIDSTGQKKNHL